MSERPDPLDRLSAFDHVQAPDQWDEIVRRADDQQVVTELRTVGAARRRRWLLAAAAATVLAVGATVLFAANRGDDGEITTLTDPPTVPSTSGPTVTSTVAPSTTAPVATTVEPAPVTAAPATTAPELLAWCTETTGGSLGVTTYDGTALVPFGPIATDPALTITLPYGLEAALDSASTVRGVEPVDGGVVVLVQQTASAPSWQLVAINQDGSIRWRRCGSEQTSFGIQAGADAVYVREQAADWAAWRGFDVVTGEEAPPLGLDPLRVPISSTDRYVFVANETDSGDFQLADLLTGEVTSLPDPEFDLGEAVVYSPVVTERADGSLVVTITDGTAVLAVYVDGAWRTDRDTLLREVPLQVSETFDGDLTGLGTGVLARDPLGATVWFHDTVNGIRAEGWATGVLGDVVLTNECRADDPNVSYGCAEQWHVALDLDTGEVLWEQPGFVAVGPSDRNIAMIADDAGWSLMDVRTGEVLQADLPSFSTACCGEDAFIWAERDGGVVWSVDYQTLRVYYPVGVSPGPVEVELTAD